MRQVPEIEEWLDQVLQGKREAFQRIVREYSLPLRSYLAAQVYHLDDADDLAQDVFIAAYRSLHAFRRGDDFGAWLRGIARNKLYGHLRSKARREKTLARFRAEIAHTVEADLERAASGDGPGTIEILLHCIGRLPEKMRRVVRAGLDGDKPSVLAEELLTSVGAIYTLHYRANKLLRECMQKELD